jgi:hypothetical protein
VLFAVRESYTPAVHAALAVSLLGLISAAAWKLGARAIGTDAEDRRALALAGTLMIAPWALFSLLAGYSTPWVASAEENRTRYVVLFVGACAMAGGLAMLREALGKAGERLLSTLGLVAILLATPLYLVCACILITVCSVTAYGSPGPAPPWVVPLAGGSDILLFFGGALAYVATAAFAASLGAAGWLGRRTARALAAASLLALLLLCLRGPQFPDPSQSFDHWYQVAGFIAGIPAVPWILPVIMGVVLLKRAGREAP